MSNNDKLLSEIKKLLMTAVEEIKEDNKNTLDILKSEFERKLDIIANMENITSEKTEVKKNSKAINDIYDNSISSISASSAPSSSQNKPKENTTPLKHLQNTFKTSYTTYIDILYTEVELNEALANEELKKLKEGTAVYKKKLASIIYNNNIKNNSKKMEQLTKFKDDATE